MLSEQVEHVKAERTALSVVDSPYIVTLYYSFQDSEFLYLVMEYLPGGDIMTLLIRKDILSEHETRFYIAETILALEQIHAKGYLHRCGLLGTYFARYERRQSCTPMLHCARAFYDLKKCKPTEFVKFSVRTV